MLWLTVETFGGTRLMCPQARGGEVGSSARSKPRFGNRQLITPWMVSKCRMSWCASTTRPGSTRRMVYAAPGRLQRMLVAMLKNEWLELFAAVFFGSQLQKKP